MPALKRHSQVIRRWMAAALILSAILAVPGTADAQFGRRLRGGDNGKVYGLDVRETPSLVFVVDFAIHKGPGFIDQVGDVATGDATEETQQDVAQKSGESVALAVVPGGMLIGAGLNQHRDRAGRAENNLRDAIKGLKDDQDFGIVYFDSVGSRTWHDALVKAEDENRDAAEQLIDDLYEGQGLLYSATMGISDKVSDDESESHEPPSAQQLLAGIRRAFALGPQTIVVIVAESPPDAGALLHGVAALNADGRVVIHTAGFTEEEGTASALRDLAEANGGVYLLDDTPNDEAEDP
ncbi:MAG TPA: hypothetical protein VFQ21_02070 [Gemmatimonadota bacterium]|nr:hypothetical protein [Gemmatimonadota bacterium]